MPMSSSMCRPARQTLDGVSFVAQDSSPFSSGGAGQPCWLIFEPFTNTYVIHWRRRSDP